MKIINVNNFYNYPLTVDSTIITVDSTEWTADQISFTSSALFITVIPRDYPDVVNITFYNELKETTFTEECIVFSKNGYMDIPFTYSVFEEGDSFEITVKGLDDKLLWRGKAYVTMDDDLQNYKLIKKDDNNKIEF